MGRKTENIFSGFAHLFTILNGVMSAENACKSNRFKTVHRVRQPDLSSNTLSSHTGIKSRAMCAEQCMNEDGCLSFSYTRDDKRCETYSMLLLEVIDGDISNSTVYSSKIVPTSGVYSYAAIQGQIMDVFVDVENEDGPWIVIQRRTSGDVDFYRDWNDYKNGFGDLLGNFWIGNDKLHLLTRSMNILRVEIESWDGTKGYAQYSTFKVADERYNYKLTVTGFSGNVSYDAMGYHNGYDFTTRDRDHDVRGDANCAARYYGGWWYGGCLTCNLNGLYKMDTVENDNTDMMWADFPPGSTPLKTKQADDSIIYIDM